MKKRLTLSLNQELSKNLLKTKLDDIDPADLKLYSLVQKEIREIEAKSKNY